SARSTSRSAWVTLRSTSPNTGRVCATTTPKASRARLAERIGFGRQRALERGQVEHLAHRLLQLGQAAFEEMSSALEQTHPLGLGPGRVRRLQIVERAQLVGSSLNDCLGLGAASQEGEVATPGSGRDREQGVDTRIARPLREGHARAERKAAQEQAASWIETKEKADGGRGVFFLAGTARPLAFASSHAAEVEAQRGQPGLEQRFGRAIGHLVVHRAA